MTTPLLLHIPHASTAIPEAYRRDFLTDPAAELRLMTDWYTDELFDLPAPRVVFPVSRLVCDVERFRDDAQEEMARCGMGACYTNGHDGAPIRRLDAARREAILRRWYDPHHARLTALTAAALARSGACTIVDCHSFPAAPLPYESDQRPDRPDVCIGTDAYHTPPQLADALAEAFTARGYSVAFNAPFAGALVPLRWYRREPRVRSVMIELNRGLYLDGACRRGPAFSRLKRDVAQILTAVSQRVPQ